MSNTDKIHEILNEDIEPDITKCCGDGCPLADRCRRKVVGPNEVRQAYFSVAPHDQQNGCDYFIQTHDVLQ